MISITQKILPVFLMLFLMSGMFGIAFAQTQGDPDFFGDESQQQIQQTTQLQQQNIRTQQQQQVTRTQGQQQPTRTQEDSASLVNPLKFNTIQEFFEAVINVITIIAVPIIVFFIIWAGFLYVTAGGDPGKIQRATTTFTWVVIGGLLILGANVILAVIKGTVDSFVN